MLHAAEADASALQPNESESLACHAFDPLLRCVMRLAAYSGKVSTNSRRCAGSMLQQYSDSQRL